MYLIVTTAHSTIQHDVYDLAFCCAKSFGFVVLACLLHLFPETYCFQISDYHHANMKHVAVTSLVSKMLVASLVSVIYSTALMFTC